MSCVSRVEYGSSHIYPSKIYPSKFIRPKFYQRKVWANDPELSAFVADAVKQQMLLEVHDSFAKRFVWKCC